MELYYQMIKITEELLERYHRGACSPEEALAVQSWLQNEEAEASFPDTVDIGQAEREVWAHLQENIVKDKANPAGNRLKYLRWGGIAAAASIVVFWGISYFFGPPAALQENPSLSYNTIEVPNGKQMQITLPDGSSVRLNAGSSLQYPERFDDSLRRVVLAGEAFFTVARDTAKAFVITSPRGTVRVLGTEFNLKAYPGDSTESLVVSHGRVKFTERKSGRSVILAKDEGAVLGGAAVLSKMQQTDIPGDQPEWVSGGMAFSDQPLRDVFRTIERRFDVTMEVQLKPGALDQRYTGDFMRPDLKTVMQSLSFAYGFRYSIKDKVITVY